MAAPNKRIFDNLKKMDTSYLLDPSVMAEVESVESASEKNEITAVELERLVPFRKHPFRVNTEGEEFLQLVESIREHGVLYPILVRPLEDKYEIISGHCRAEASRICGLTEIPAKIVPMDDFMAAVVMTHTNIYGRDRILISEKAKAYRLCLDEEKNAGHNRTDTAAAIGAGRDSKRQVQRFVRLSYLNDELLGWIDSGKLTVQIGTELAFLDAGSQQALCSYIQEYHHIPDLEQARLLRSTNSRENTSLSLERVISLLTVPKKVKTANNVSFKTKDLAFYFDEGTEPEKMRDVVLLLLAKYKAGEFKAFMEE